MLIKGDNNMNFKEAEKLIDNERYKLENGSDVQANRRHSHRRFSHRRQSGYRRKIERVVFKSGHFNFEKLNRFKYNVLPDIVKAFVDARWRWTLIYCIITYILIWLVFTGVWWLILDIHGDLEPDHLPHSTNSSDWVPCVKEIYGFTSLFLFSIEIHTTIGYGSRTITLECPSAMLTMCIESIIGTITQSFIVGIVFAKLTRPKNRAQTLIFSKNAIINQRDRDLCLMFRVGNTRKSRVISVSVQAYMIRHGSDDSFNNQTQLLLSIDSSETVSFMFPISAVHRIDCTSPFYSMSAYDILKSELEIIVIFEGTIESTGQPVQVKSSYTTYEILWGHRFVDMVDFHVNKPSFVIDYSKFNETITVDTPLCSAKQLYLYYKKKFSEYDFDDD